MTRPLRSSSDASAGYTRLERAVFQALAAELAAQVPDLARQVDASRPTVRKNSGFGVFTELSPSPMWGGTAAKPPGWGTVDAPATNLSGDLGSVHAVLSGLRDPVRFTARLQHGRLVGLMGDSYGQDTRHIDFATAHVAQLFTLDASGRSIPIEGPAQDPLTLTERARPPVPKRPPPTRAPQADAPIRGLGEDLLTAAFGARSAPAAATPQAARPAVVEDAPRPLAGVLQQVQNHARYNQTAAIFAGTVAPPGSLPRPGDPVTDRTSLLIGAWALLAVAAVLARILFDIPWIFALVAAFWIGAALRKPMALDALQKGVDTWNSARAASRR